MIDVLIGGGIITTFVFAFGVFYRQLGVVKKDIDDVKMETVSKKEYDGHKLFCGSEFDHLKTNLKDLKFQNVKMNETLTEVRDIVLELKARADERRKGDISK